MKTSVFVFLIVFFSLSSAAFSQNGWSQITSPTTAWLEDIQAIDNNNIYAAGLGYTIIKSTNSGTSFQVIYSGAINSNFYSISFADQNTGFVSGGVEETMPPYNHTGIVMKTTNAGANWQTVLSMGGPLFTFLKAYSPQLVYCCNTNFAYFSNDGGANWSTVPGIFGANSVFFINSNTGFITASSSVYKTTDAGANWTGSNLSQGSLIKMIFANANTGYITRYAGSSIMKTTNCGVNWTGPVAIPDLTYANNLFCTGGDTLFVAGSSQSAYYGRIVRSTNGGVNWTTQYSGSSSYTQIFSVNFANSLTGFAVGPVGLILKTTNGGITGFSNINTGSIPEAFALHPNYPNPFNPSTLITFDIPWHSGNEIASLTIYDAEGNLLEVIVNEVLKPGTYSVSFNAGNFSSGVYFCRLAYGNTIRTQKMILLK
jgi:photosystem II stability/assembly factor-like uncharacterized protein